MTYMLNDIDEAIDRKFLVTKKLNNQVEPGTIVHIMDAHSNKDGSINVYYRITYTKQEYTVKFDNVKQFCKWARPDNFIARHYENFNIKEIQRYVKVKDRTFTSFCLPLILLALLVIWILCLVLLGGGTLAIIAGVILSMPVRAIDELLKAFGYEKLNNRDYTECLLIRILEDAEKLFPSAFLYESSRTDGAAEEFDQKKIIGNNIKSARREIRDGAKRVLITLYPDWFELIGNDRANPDAYALIADIPEDLDDEIIPSLIWPESLLRWSMRLHVRLCLLCAGMAQTDQSNWLLEGLENGYCVEDLELLTRVEQ